MSFDLLAAQHVITHTQQRRVFPFTLMGRPLFYMILYNNNNNRYYYYYYQDIITSTAVDEFEIVCHDVGDMQVDDPVHEIEADEADGEDDPRVLVNVGRRETVEFVEILARRDHDGRRLLVDPRTVDDHGAAAAAVVDHRLAADGRRRHHRVLLARRRRLVDRHRLPVRTHQESHLLHVVYNNYNITFR